MPNRLEVRRARRLVERRFEEVAVLDWQSKRTVEPFRKAKEEPMHVLVLIASFALTGYAVNKVRLDVHDRERIAIWFAASFIGHDAILFPLYALADRTMRVPFLMRRRQRQAQRHPQTVTQHAAAVNAIRVPALLSGLLLLVFQGPIQHQGDAFFRNASTLHESNYLARWLLTTGVLFLGSAVFYAVRMRAHRTQTAS